MPVISAHGISIYADRVSGVIREAASPMISIHLTKASVSTLSFRRIAAIRPAPMVIASWAASRMWRKRTRSLGGILDGRVLHDLVPEIRAQLAGSAEINLPAAEENG